MSGEKCETIFTVVKHTLHATLGVPRRLAPALALGAPATKDAGINPPCRVGGPNSSPGNVVIPSPKHPKLNKRLEQVPHALCFLSGHREDVMKVVLVRIISFAILWAAFPAPQPVSHS